MNIINLFLIIGAWLSLVERCVRDVKTVIKNFIHRRVAQLGRALRSGRRSRRFKSCHADFSLKIRAFLKARIFCCHFFDEDLDVGKIFGLKKGSVPRIEKKYVPTKFQQNVR